MAEVKRYVVVDEQSGVIVPDGGPYLWDGEAEWEPPVEGTLMLEAVAYEHGYRFAEE